MPLGLGAFIPGLVGGLPVGLKPGGLVAISSFTNLGTVFFSIVSSTG
jgi:hypothetical protein